MPKTRKLKDKKTENKIVTVTLTTFGRKNFIFQSLTWDPESSFNIRGDIVAIVLNSRPRLRTYSKLARTRSNLGPETQRLNSGPTLKNVHPSYDYHKR